MSLPDAVRDRLRDLLWARAKELGWSDLPDSEKSKFYERWTREKEVGGALAYYMDARKVRVYIKDSLVKPYERSRLSRTEEQVLERVGIDSGGEIEQRYIKPHGLRFPDGRIVCWGNSRDWKSIAMAMYEREASTPGASAYGMVLLESGQTADPATRRLVQGAAGKLGVQRLEWLE